jgi:NAD(P)-dependent dehydrogenase (short-subunit alcohol dehydrogenase family)
MSSNRKTVIVTGASSGIGFAIARAYLQRGYNVVGNARSAERLQAAADELGNPGNFIGVAGDIADPATARALFTEAIGVFGQVDILVNNAGIFIAKPTVDYTEADVDAIVGTNLKGFFYPSQLAAEHMAAREAGQIINITASIAIQPNAKVPALLPVLIKGGLNQATRALALELAASNVKVNAVAPGIIETPLHGDYEGTRGFYNTLAPSGTTGVVQDVVDAVLYLTDSNFSTGVVLPVDGGATTGVWQA